MKSKNCISPLDAFFDIRRHEGEWGCDLFSRMEDSYMQMPSSSLLDKSILHFIKQFMRVYEPNSIHWPKSLKPVTLDQMSELIGIVDKKRYEDGDFTYEYGKTNQMMQPIEETCASEVCNDDMNGDEVIEDQFSTLEDNCSIKGVARDTPSEEYINNDLDDMEVQTCMHCHSIDNNELEFEMKNDSIPYNNE